MFGDNLLTVGPIMLHGTVSQGFQYILKTIELTAVIALQPGGDKDNLDRVVVVRYCESLGRLLLHLPRDKTIAHSQEL